MKFYTDPSYFAELWAIEMGKQIQENRKLHEKKKKGREVDMCASFFFWLCGFSCQCFVYCGCVAAKGV